MSCPYSLCCPSALSVQPQGQRDEEADPIYLFFLQEQFHLGQHNKNIERVLRVAQCFLAAVAQCFLAGVQF